MMDKHLKQGEVSSTVPREKRIKAAGNEPRNVVVTGPDTGGYGPPRLQHELDYVAGLDGIEQSLDWIATGISKLTSDEHYVHLSTEGTHPIRITLAHDDYEDVMDRFVTAVERIADSVAKLVGFGRPRLERWHEQCEYEPRYRASASDGGAAGPKQEAQGHTPPGAS